MTKRYTCLNETGCRLLMKHLILFVFLLVPVFKLSAQQALNFSFKNNSLSDVINQISSKSGYQFVYDASYVKQAKPISFSVKAATINQVMDLVVKNQTFDYEINNKTIVLKFLRKDDSMKINLKGLVLDSLGQPLPGATIKIKGSKTFVKTDARGRFAIPVADNSVIDVSFVGFQNEEVHIGKLSNNEVVIKLRSSASLLSEVVIQTGYQALSRERSTAAAAFVDRKTLNENINTDLISALEGRVAGLVYSKNPNGVDADKPILRGVGTLSSNNVGYTPLIVIDGLPTEFTLDQINPYDVESITVLKDAAAASIYGVKAGNGIIVVTTKRGSGAAKISANADFFITTKPDLSKMHYASTSEMIDYETAVYNKERSKYTTTESMFQAYGDVASGTIKYYSPLYQLYRDRDAGKYTQDQVSDILNTWRGYDYINDYTNNVWRNEGRQRYNLSLSASNSKINSFASLNYDRSALRTVGNDDDNVSLYFKNAYSPKKWITATFGLNANYSVSTSTESEYNSYFLQPRYARIVDENGDKVYADYVNIGDSFSSSGAINGAVAAKLNSNPEYKSTAFNILDALNEGKLNKKSIALRSFANLQFNLLKSLKYNTQFSYELGENRESSYYDANSYKMRYAYNVLTAYTSTPTAKYTHYLPAGGRFYQRETGRNSLVWRNQLSFDRNFESGKHAITALAGSEIKENNTPRSIQDLRYGYDPVTLSYQTIDTYTLSQTGISSYIYGSTKTLSAGIDKSQSEIKHRYASFYGNFGYTYLGKYNLTGSARVDKADLFGVQEKDKTRPLWSLGLGWNASNEEFLKKFTWLNMLKLRASYGSNGNIDQNSTSYLTAKIKSDNLFPSLSYYDITLPNPKLRWEKISTLNFGLDYAVLHNRLRGNIDVYNRKSTDLLSTTDLETTVGTSSLTINSGSLSNKGIELSIGGDWLKKKDFNISSQLNIAFNSTIVKKVTRAEATAGSYVADGSTYFELGTSYNSLYAYRYGGMVNGYPYFLDENGNPTIQFDENGNPITSSIKSISKLAALERMGPLTPTFAGSFSQRFNYKGLELGLLFVFSGGNYLRKDVLNLSSYTITDKDLAIRYSADNTNQPRSLVDYPVALDNYASTISSMWEKANIHVVKADYIKLRNISLAYNLPGFIVKGAHISAAKVTAQINNLWYKSAAGDDIDPESYSLNSGTRTIPTPKSYLLGLSLSF